MLSYMLVFYIVTLLLSLCLLWVAGDLSVRYSIQTASMFKMRTLFVGFVLIAISTGFPELSVVIASLFENVTPISAGTILGSNVCDISLVLGLPILLSGKLLIKPEENKDAGPMFFIAALAMALVFLLGSLQRITGLFLILIYFVSLWGLWRNRTRKEMIEEEKEQERVVLSDGNSFFKTKTGIIVKLLCSLALVLVASELVVRFAIKLTSLLSLSLATVGATILAVGTSLPELTLSLQAVRKREYDLAIGNSLGSVLEQGTLLLGILAVSSPTPIKINSLRMIAPFMFLSFAVLGFGLFKRRRLTRIEGSIMLAIFCSFIVYYIIWIQ